MNPFHYFDRAIISIDTLKKDAKYRAYLEDTHWDAIVVDECQNVAVRTKGSHSQQSQRARLAQLLARTTDALIFTSATPHDGSAESFASLVNLLEPTAIADEKAYTHEDVRDHFVRRFKKDIAHEVDDAFQERAIEPVHVDASPPEDEVLQALREVTFETIAADTKSRGILFRTLLLKAFLSSPAACSATLSERRKRLNTASTAPKKATKAQIATDTQTLDDLLGLVTAVGVEHFSKYQRLLAHLRELGYGAKATKRRAKGKPLPAPDADRIVLFSERIDTLLFLQEHLASDLGLDPDHHLALFHGSMSDQEQADVVRRFGSEDSSLRILLASDAASEGLNLHFFCHRLIHFDLPWSLITLEQRNGRIDRFGQAHQPILTYLLTRPTDPDLQGDLRILDRLVEKEGQAHKNLGDAAWLMGLHSAEREEERVAAAIESGEAPEDVIPDEPESDWLDDLLGDDGAREQDAETTRRPTLYPDLQPGSETGSGRPASGDLAYTLEAARALELDRDELIEHHAHLDAVVLRAPDNLLHRLRYLPPELQRDVDGTRPVFRLTVDRERVMDALAQARRHEDGWPEWQLLWEQHPICEWLDDTVAAHFDRHEAPVLRVPTGLGSDQTAFVFQGQLTNLRGQPMIVEWFAVLFDGDRPERVVPFLELIERTGLHRPLPNPGHDLAKGAREHLESLRRPAVDAAATHMQELRADRMEKLAAPLREGIRRLGRWQRARLALLDEAAAKPNLAAPRKQALEANRRHVQALYTERRDWIEKGIATNPSSHLRLATILLPAG